MRPRFPQGEVKQLNEALKRRDITPEQYRKELFGLPSDVDRHYIPKEAGNRRVYEKRCPRREVLEFIKNHGPVTSAEVARRLCFSKRAVHIAVQDLFKHKHLTRRGRGGYYDPYQYSYSDFGTRRRPS